MTIIIFVGLGISLKSYLDVSLCLSGNATYPQHLINHGHSVGHMEDIRDVIFTAHKGKHLDTAQKCHIYQKTKNIHKD